jgi:hypothetical protein
MQIMMDAFVSVTRNEEPWSDEPEAKEKAAADALLPDKVRILWSISNSSHHGGPDAMELYGVPPFFTRHKGILALPWVSQPAVLAHPAVKLFLSHCGLGSVHESLVAGKPIIGLPFNADQPTIANQVRRETDRAVSWMRQLSAPENVHHSSFPLLQIESRGLGIRLAKEYHEMTAEDLSRAMNL